MEAVRAAGVTPTATPTAAVLVPGGGGVFDKAVRYGTVRLPSLGPGALRLRELRLSTSSAAESMA